MILWKVPCALLFWGAGHHGVQWQSWVQVGKFGKRWTVMSSFRFRFSETEIKLKLNNWILGFFWSWCASKRAQRITVCEKCPAHHRARTHFGVQNGHCWKVKTWGPWCRGVELDWDGKECAYEDNHNTYGDKVSTVSGDVFVMHLLKRLLNSVGRCF